MKFYLVLTSASSLIASTLAAVAPLIKPSNDAIEGSYIVVLKDNLRNTLDSHIQQVQALFTDRTGLNKIEDVYRNLGNAYHARFTDGVLEQVRNIEDVDFVEVDAKVQINTVQRNATWGISRISQRKFIFNSTYTYKADGSGVNVYVIDTGIDVNHPEFEGRAKFGARFAGADDEDGHGHGTHCAGTIGSKTYGVSKKVSITAVKVLGEDGSGTNSGVISGINWAVGDKKGIKGNVISMSLGGSKSAAVNNAVEAAYQSGFVVVVAAGNESKDACDTSPASSPNAITVGASDIRDKLASFSNFGKCVDIIAPGVKITSTWKDGGINTISGTSMATPHVAGIVAYYLSQGNLTSAQITSKLTTTATKSILLGIKDKTPNLLAYNSYI